VVGQSAEIIDPLSQWHYYIKKHPEYKKNLLKGNASLAQEIYNLYYLLTGVWEVITGKKAEPIFEFIHKDFGVPFFTPKTDYVNGEDVMALKYSIKQFKNWKVKNKKFVSGEVAQKILSFENELTDYEKRYEARSYAGSTREIYPEKNIKLENLDEKTKHIAESFFKDLSSEQAIAQALEWRLGDLRKELSEIFHDVLKQFRDKENAAWQKERDFSNFFWARNREKLNKLTREEQIKLSRKEAKKIRTEANFWKEKQMDFHRAVSWYADLVFCKICKKEPIRLYSEDSNINVWGISYPKICDSCLQKISQKSLDMPEEDWKGIKEGEWNCDYCGNRTLYKFVQNNVLSLWTLAKIPIKVNLVYGKAILEAKCPNCNKVNQKIMDWGWNP
jgi:hypothetical protein